MRISVCSGWPALLLVGLLSSVLSLPAVVGLMVNDAEALQHLENRRMASPPALSLLGESSKRYIEALDNYLKDHAGWRHTANQLYRKLRYYVLRDPPMENITIGRDGFVFMNSHREDKPNFVFQLLCEQQVQPEAQLVEAMDRTFASVSGYYSARGYEVTIAAAPTNVALYADKLPRTVEKQYRDACLAYPSSDYLLAQLERQGRVGDRYRLYYPLELFRAHRDEPYFYPREKWHWTGRSAYLFARDLLRFSGVLDRLIVDDPAAVGKVGDDLVMFFGFSRQVQALVYPYANVKSTVERPKWAASLSKGGGLLHYASQPGLSDKRGLLIANSFGIDLAPHLAKGFGEFYFYNLNALSQGEEERLFTRIVDLSRPDHIYVLFDDAGIIAAPDRLKVFVKLHAQQSAHPSTAPESDAGPVH